jgi:hypothetical protein
MYEGLRTILPKWEELQTMLPYCINICLVIRMAVEENYIKMVHVEGYKKTIQMF